MSSSKNGGMQGIMIVEPGFGGFGKLFLIYGNIRQYRSGVGRTVPSSWCLQEKHWINMKGLKILFWCYCGSLGEPRRGPGELNR